MGSLNIKSMSNAELEQYIKNTRESIEQLLDEYVKINHEKLRQNERIQVLYKRAFDIRDIYQYVQWANDKLTISSCISERLSIIPKRGEIWTCQLGKNIGSEENKIRPVIIVQNDTGNEKGPTTIIVPISKRPKRIATHIELMEKDYSLMEGETDKVTGTVLCEQIKVVSKARLGRHIATLEAKFMNNILTPKLKLSIGL